MHLKYIQHNLFAVCLLSVADDNPIDPPWNYDQTPGGWDALSVQPPQPGVPDPPSHSKRQADMRKIIQAVQGTIYDIDKAMMLPFSFIQLFITRHLTALSIELVIE
jgi:hypothetical protein